MNKKEYMQYQLLISSSARFNQHFPIWKNHASKKHWFLKINFKDIPSTNI